MKLTLLGTGSSLGVPVIACDCDVCLSENPKDKRLRSSLLIEDNNHSIVIDTGPDFRMQMLNAKVQNLDAVLYTHQHRDHIAGLDDIRAFNYILNKEIELYATKEIIKSIKHEFPYIFTDTNYLGAPKVNLNEIENEQFSIFSVKFQPIQVEHFKIQAFGYRFNDVCYIPDVNKISSEEYNKMKGSRIIIIDALRKSRHISHLSLQESIEILNDLKPEFGYITHMSHFIGLHSTLEKNLPDFIKPAYDGLEIYI